MIHSSTLLQAEYVVITPGVLARIWMQDVLRALERHAHGDWGDVSEYDWKVNDDAVESGDRVFSRYSSESGVFYVVTEPDRSQTNVLLPEEYHQ